ncbi:hypothetical protein BOX15_Mlig011707g2 [Macrostomum lignano]|uniref:Innexin n=1 Tax=Macrostomum lignano TaxID=282301 RepID=A0A267ECE8_9PLAT|nr:hypothetical protein BOX15_Mlig011707g2 [Macrostomum lignano]
MNENAINQLSLIADSHGVYAEDFADQLMSKYTSLGLMLTATVLAMRQYIFKPIQCWVPAEWPRPWEEYAENYCWIQNTYNLAFREPGFPGLQAREEAEISYFQWVPFLLSIQALLVFLPHLLWRVTSARSGGEPHRIVKLASELASTGKPKRKRRKMAEYLAKQLRKSIAIAGTVTGSRLPCCGSNRCACWLFVSYIVNKFVYVLNGLGQLYLMKTYLGYQDLHFGWSSVSHLLNERYWQQTGIFPRVTFCDIPIKQVGQWNTRSVQCVLPMNMLNEKIYIFLWFWIVLCMALQVVYCVFWIASIAPPAQRLKFMRSLVRLESPHSGLGPAVDTPSKRTFMRDHLRLDGVFILQMVAEKCGNLCAARILGPMMRHYEEGDSGLSECDITEITDYRERSSRCTLPIRENGRIDNGFHHQ